MRGRKPVEIVVTFTRLAPESAEERECVQQARSLWVEGQLQARGQEIERARNNRQAQHRLGSQVGAG